MKQSPQAILIMKGAINLHTKPPKEAKVLKESGYTVKMVCWDCMVGTPPINNIIDYGILRQFRFKIPSRGKAVFFWPIWWCYLFGYLMFTNWDIAHAFSIDSIPPVAVVGRLKRKPVIYELTDTCEDALYLPRRIRDTCIWIDKSIMRLVSAIILADDQQIEEFGGIPNSRVVVIHDSPVDVLDGKIRNPSNHKSLSMFYCGALLSVRSLNLDKICSAVEDIDDVKITFAGYGDLVAEIEKLAKKMPGKIEYIGTINYNEVIKISTKTDLLFVIRSPSPSQLQNKYVSGSKLFEAMMCGKPILVANGTSTAIKAIKECCGLAVDANKVEEIRTAIVKLRDDPDLRNRLGANSRKAYEEKYGWHIMRKLLINLYTELMSNK